MHVLRSTSLLRTFCRSVMSASKRPRDQSWVSDPAGRILNTVIGSDKPNPSQTDLVIYHGPYCPDGFGAAFSAWKLLGDRATYLPADHGPSAPRGLDVKGKHVAVLDYSFPAAETARMIAEAASFVCIDHHASAVKELADVPEANKVFEMGQSGATLAYNYFHPGQEVPLLLRYVEDKDIWR